MQYVVKSGDTLSSIASRYNTTVDKIMAVNEGVIHDKNKIYVGQTIEIPDQIEVVSFNLFPANIETGGIISVEWNVATVLPIGITNVGIFLQPKGVQSVKALDYPGQMDFELSLGEKHIRSVQVIEKQFFLRPLQTPTTNTCQAANLPIESNNEQKSPFEDQKSQSELAVFDEEPSGNRHFCELSNTLEIVQKDSQDTVSIHYTGSDAPDKLSVSKNNEYIKSIAGTPRSGGQLFEFQAKYFPEDGLYSINPKNLIKSLFTYFAKPTYYTISGLKKTITVKAYNPDQWKLSLKLPAIKGLKLGAQMSNTSEKKVSHTQYESLKENSVEKNFQLSQEETKWTQSKTIEISGKYKEYTSELRSPDLYEYSSSKSLSAISKTSQDANKISVFDGLSLERNGTSVNIDILDIILGIISLVSRFSQAVKRFKDYVPKIGWYIDFEVKVLEGIFELAWGWRETSGHQVFYYLGLGVNLNIFEIMLEIGFGVSVASVGGQICIQFKGGISLNIGQFETIAQDAKSIKLGDVKGVLEAGGYVRCNAGDLLIIEGGIKSSISISSNAEINFNTGFELKGQTVWDGLIVTLKAQTFIGWQRNTNISLMEPSNMGTIKFPGDKSVDIEDEIKNSYEISKIIEKSLLDGLNIRVFETKWQSFLGYWYEEDVPVKASDVADIISQEIWKQRHLIMMDSKTINGLAHSIRKECEIIGNRDWARDFLYKDQLIDFLGSPKFAKLIDDATDPAKAYMADLKR
ncbi:Peptidoglycan-binding Lysin subgroup domain protein [Candidatus Magnetomorum sp. HK-1]|nr:Peptidoglycan-binding Lysin subgroup domain protein [Candidatus Magnetomorum sp. HK-1]